MSNSDLPSSAQTLILLDKNHPLTALIVMDAHRRVMASKRRSQSSDPLIGWYGGDSLSAR